MDTERLAGAAGIAAAAALVALIAATYAILDPTAIGPYFAASPGGPPLLALFGLLSVVVLAAGLAGRQDPAVMAGVAVVVGVFSTLLAWWWAISVSPSLVGGLTTVASFAYHRWAVAVAATALLVASAGYARAVLREPS